MSKTKIEWTEYSWNPVSGCTPISEGCQNCYAKRMANRLRGRCGYPADEPFKVTLHKDRLEEPLRWKKPHRVFVCSMGDLFHEDVPRWMRFEVMDIILQAKQHTFLILTKRPANMKEFFEWYYSKAGRTIETIKNLWLGVTAENQQRADERIPILLQIPAAVLFVSVEPMLGPIALNAICAVVDGFAQRVKTLLDGIDWVICGGETGPNARSMHPDWVRSLRDQCVEAGVPFFFKQWGEWLPDDQVKEPLIVKMGHPGAPKWAINKLVCNLSPGLHAFKVGKKAAGRLLDGREWNEYPIREKIEP